VDIDSLGVALHPFASCNELVERDVSGTIGVQQLCQQRGVTGSEADHVKVSTHNRIRQQKLNLLQADVSVTVLVCRNKELNNLIQAGALLIDGLFNLDFALFLGILHSIVHKNTCEDVHQSQDGENDVSEHQSKGEHIHLRERISHLEPANSAQRCLKKCVDAPRDVAKEVMNLFHTFRISAGQNLVLPTLSSIVDLSLQPVCARACESDCKYVHDQEEHDHGPKQLLYRICHHQC